MKCAVFFLLLAAACSFQDAQAERLPTGKVTIHVLDENGALIEGAEASVGFVAPGTTPGYKSTYEPNTHISGLTDKSGNFSATRKCLSWLSGSAVKDGYYLTVGDGYDFKSEKNGKWQPWNPTLTLVLKKIINPIPMYVKQVEGLKVPVLDQPVGYDLCIGDWVEPHGKGKVGDFVFFARNYFKSREDFYSELTMTFSNPDDGIQVYFARRGGVGSEFIFPHEAPDKGYESVWTNWVYVKGENSSQSPKLARYPGHESGGEINYIFRVRTTKLPDGTVVGLYGKIRDNVKPGGLREDQPTIDFTYYLNPTGTRNLEFKPGWNIFDLERPYERIHDYDGVKFVPPPRPEENFPP